MSADTRTARWHAGAAPGPRQRWRRLVVTGALPFVFWAALWRHLSPGIVLGGVAVVALALWLVPPSDPRDRIRWLPALGLFRHVLGQLVVATAHVAWEVLTPTDRSRPGTVDVQLPDATALDLTVVGLLITLTPGSFVADIDPGRRTVLVHVLHLSGEESVRAEVADLARRVARVTTGGRPGTPADPSADDRRGPT